MSSCETLILYLFTWHEHISTVRTHNPGQTSDSHYYVIISARFMRTVNTCWYVRQNDEKFQPKLLCDSLKNFATWDLCTSDQQHTNLSSLKYIDYSI
jgi:hypothetical protein